MSNDTFSTLSEEPERFEMPDDSQGTFRPKSSMSGGNEATFTTYTEPEEQTEPSGLRPGDLLDGRFELTEVIGSGAMGEVWLAHELLTTGEYVRDVVVKVVSRHIRNLDVEIQRVRATFKTIESLSHSQICPIYHLGSDDRFGYFLVMKYIIGRNLSEFTADYRKSNNKQPSLDILLPMLKQIAAALDYAHGKGVIHRDIKPQNILVGDEDGAQLIDFGLAETACSGTGTDVAVPVLGTVEYMSPEQLEGRQQDGRSDQYSFAATVYELLTGQPPFVAGTKTILRNRILHDEVMPVRDVAECVNAALVQALAKERDGRFSSCTEFVEAIGEGADVVVQKSSFRAKMAPQPAAPGVESLMKRGHLFLEDADWKQANDYFDRVLDIDPEYAPAYVGKLCAELKVKSEEKLGDYQKPISEFGNFQKAVRFADDEYKAKVEGYDEKIRERIRQEQYDRLVQTKNKASTEFEYEGLGDQFRKMNGYKDTTALADECDTQYRTLKEKREKKERQERERRAEQERKDREERERLEEQKRQDEYKRLGEKVKAATNEDDWLELAEEFRIMKGYKNTAELLEQCICKAQQVRYQRLCAKTKTTSTEENWLKLAEEFQAMNGYKNTLELASQCYGRCRKQKERREEQKRQEEYDRLIQAMNKDQNEIEYRELAKLLRAMNGYKNTAELANVCDQRSQAYKKRRQEQEWMEQDQLFEEKVQGVYKKHTLSKTGQGGCLGFLAGIGGLLVTLYTMNRSYFFDTTIEPGSLQSNLMFLPFFFPVLGFLGGCIIGYYWFRKKFEELAQKKRMERSRRN